MAIVPSADIIVTGIGLMGVMDGLEFVRTVRRAVARHISVIVLTAYAFPTDRERAFAAGCDRFLPKPCLPHTLLTEIIDILNAAHRTPDTFAQHAMR
jgi:CheY-like chemotaxis protein